ncbi:MAG: hypothetical protein DRP71_15490 [Verrucomicrobia bacterium]|nr:MAG: hypothetical protein DRP71_15490 [Verrucomicrobiota bacterium]
MKNLLATFLAALAMFVWGFAYYGVSGIPYKSLQPAQNVGAQLDELFPTTGTYVIPDPRTENDKLSKQLEKGPFATVHIRKGGTPAMDPLLMAKGFILGWVCCLMMAVLLAMTGIRGYGPRLVFILFAGVIMALFTHGGDVIWWRQDWAWQIHTMIYSIGAWLVAGLLLACSPKAKD